MDEDVFSRDDARVRTLVSGLRGRVLDLGCGEAPYGAEIAALVEAGEVEYVGVDPHALRVSELRERWPNQEFIHARAEDMEVAPESFDHVLLLRSWNHLKDPGVLGEKFVGALRRGGTLTIVDNTVFGLARSPAQAERGESSTAEQEHYRNDTAAVAAARIQDPRLDQVIMSEVAADTSNQWILQYRRHDRVARQR
jgi:SAM-dependent methyltransferase